MYSVLGESSFSTELKRIKKKFKVKNCIALVTIQKLWPQHLFKSNHGPTPEGCIESSFFGRRAG